MTDMLKVFGKCPTIFLDFYLYFDVYDLFSDADGSQLCCSVE
jgi:hypothetical protein